MPGDWEWRKRTAKTRPPFPTLFFLYEIMVVFSRRRLSRLTFLRVLCLQTKLSDLKMIGVFTRKIIFHVGNLRRASAQIKG